MERSKDYVTIMSGDYTQLNWVSKFLRLSGVAATVKVNIYSTNARLIVDANKENKARALSREYVDSCTRQRLIVIKMHEVFNTEDDEEFAI